MFVIPGYPKTAKRLEYILYTIILGGAAPVFLFLLAGTLWFYISRNESIVLYPVISALFTGLVIDALFLHKWLARLYRLPLSMMIILYLFYHICMFGFYMGFPALNLILAPIAGLYMGERLYFHGTGQKQYAETIRKTALFSAAVMFILCLATSALALREPGIGQEMGSILHLGFSIDWCVLLIIAIIGTVFLTYCQYYLTGWVMGKIHNIDDLNDPI